MDTTTYIALKNETQITEKDNGLIIFVPLSWIVDNEERVSYTTLIRLVECCREYHWSKDVTKKNILLDSICGSINSSFIKTVKGDSTITIIYSIKKVERKKYTIEFVIADEMDDICCVFEMIAFFYDSIAGQAIEINKDIFEILSRLT